MRASITLNKKKRRAGLLEQFKAAQQIVVTMPEDYRSNPNFMSIDMYGPGMNCDEGEIGMILLRGKISFRVFQP